MELTSKIVELFLLSLIFGLAPFSFLASPQDLGKGFLQLLEGLAMGGMAILFLLNLSGKMNLIFLLFSLLFSFLLYFRQGETTSKEIQSYRWLKILSLLIYSYLTIENTWASQIYFLFSALFMGALMYAMILGHWYLVVPKLSSAPLLKVLKIMWVGISCKIALSCVGLFWLQKILLQMEEKNFSYAMGIDHWWPYFLVGMRFIWGYVIMVTLGVFAHRLAKMHSMQSATGVLYIMVFFLLIGELISEYFSLHYGIPL